MSRAALVALLAGVGLLAYIVQRQARALDELATGGEWVASAEQAAAGAVDTVAAAVYDLTGVDMQDWQRVAARPENSVYVALLHSAEVRYGTPVNMLVRLAYQESRFRQDIISGATVSSAGAVGIMQIVPRWHPDVNPLDPAAAIDYAGRYLASLYRQFGTWELALQAYNWGPGNLKKYLTAGGSLPVETSRYSSQILADLGAMGVHVA